MTDKPKISRLWQEIVLTLAIKVIALTIIWATWFSSPEDVSLDDRKIASQILSQQTQKEHDNDAIPGTR
jgi:hypothetical protein